MAETEEGEAARRKGEAGVGGTAAPRLGIAVGAGRSSAAGGGRTEDEEEEEGGSGGRGSGDGAAGSTGGAGGATGGEGGAGGCSCWPAEGAGSTAATAW